MDVIDEIAGVLRMDRDLLLEQASRLFWRKSFGPLKQIFFKFRTKHGVKSIFELDDMLKRGVLREENVLDDFQELDYIESRRDGILAAMKSLLFSSRSIIAEENHRHRIYRHFC